MIDVLLEARLFDLSQPFESSSPVQAGNVPFTMELVHRHGVPDADGMGVALEVMTMSTHVGTHIDALSHISVNGKLFGGVPAEEAQRDGRFSDLGVESFAPLIYRGVLVDIAGARGLDRLESGDGVGAADITSACDAQGIDLSPEGAVLIRTGWGNRDLYSRDEYFATPPGVDESGAALLVDRDIRLTGSDTYMYELGLSNGDAAPVHRALIAGAGVYIVENLYLEELARQHVYEFALVIAPLLLVGASGSPIRALALVYGNED